ncbi:MAG: S8 family serine peptidase [Candidatus Coatesbacteria bacterium]|nr:S8 family serine peptidase [Candidatus Coatesbacteria bacterium]
MRFFCRESVFSGLALLTLFAICGFTYDASAGPLVKLEYAQFDGRLEGEPDIWPEYRAPFCPDTDFAYYIVQFACPITKEMKAALEEQGAYLISYIPDFAFLVRMRPKSAEKLASKTALPIEWVGPYHPAYKLSRELCDFVEKGERTLQWETPTVMVQLFPQHSRLDALTALEQLLLNSGAKTEIRGVSQNPARRRLVFSVSAGDLGQLLPEIASQPEVSWIDYVSVPVPLNDVARWVVQSNVQNSCSVWDHGIHGEGQVIGVGDTGVDADSCFFYDGSQGLPNSNVNTRQRKIIAYYDYTGEAGWDEDGHGTHIAGTLAGDNSASMEEYDENDGIAYRAKLVVQDIGDKDSLSSIPFGLDSYFRQAYNAGARIHSNSWGTQVGTPDDNSYSFRSRDVDDFMWDYPDFLIFFANGNDGPADNTVNPPATAKNCVSVGSCKNPHAPFSQNDMAQSSSHGPARDGRIKPTVVAPGEYLISAQSDANITSYNCGTATMQGTSMACPAAAATAALARQYFTEGFYPTGVRNAADAFSPSASLLKAVLIHGAADMTGNDTGGAIPAHGQGWGRVKLDDTLYFMGDSRRLIVWDISPGLQTGSFDEYTISVSSTDMLKVTLVWTDYPSTEAAQTNLVNDLDLVVAPPSGTEYRGNWFSYGLSVPGGNYDRLNVEECVYIRSPAAGDYTIRIMGYNTPQGPQPYSLVVTGAEESGAKPPTLSNGSVSPFAGSISTTFTYSVHYQDPNETAPTVKNVFIDGGPHQMHLSSGSAADGNYEYSTTLGTGSHNYYFYFEDADPLSARYPAQGTNPGPTVGGPNIAPVLSEGEVWPSAARPGTTFTYTVHYNDANADAPSEIKVFIDGTSISMQLYDGAPYLGYYRFQTNLLSVGTHTYYFYCNDGSGGDDRLPDSGTYTGPSVQEGNITPTLSNPNVTPESGTTDTTFVFTVSYFDGDGDTPATGVVFIDDVPKGMALTSGQPSNGIYAYSTRLSQGSHSFYFRFEDPSASFARAPQDGSFSLNVSAGNTAPVLSSGSVDPQSGNISENFVYGVHYYDADGDQPATGLVYIDNVQHYMTLAEGAPANGTYRYSTTLSQASHTYYFYFFDGKGGQARDPVSGAKTGPNVYGDKPLTVDLSLNSNTYSRGGWHILWISASNEGETITADLYIALYCPGGVWLYYPSFSGTAAPFLSSFELPAGFAVPSYELVRQELPALSPGTYIWYAAFTKPGTMDFESGIAMAPWSFTE